MFAGPRAVCRHGAARQWLTDATSVRHSTSLSSSIKLSSVPAPHSGSIAVLSLNRPRARNALSRQLLSELSSVIEGLHAEAGRGSTRALVLASESDDAFCAGADLKERLTFTPEDTQAFLKSLRSTFSRLSTLPIPTISAISSTAFGGGLEIALCTNFRVMSSTATVGLPETRLAIVPGAGGTYRLPALIGENRARDLILTGRRITGPEAYFLGLCDRLVQVSEEEQKQPGVARGMVLGQAVEMAKTICEGGPVAIRAAMQALDGWRQGEKSENAAYEVVLPTQDRTEALKAFGEKRKPVFKGRKPLLCNAKRLVLPHPSASPVSNPHRISANSKVTKEEALADKASPREPQLNDARSGAQILTKDRNEAAVTGSSRPAPSAISHSHPLGHGRNQSSTVGASTERSSIATSDASSSATITSGLQPRHRYYYDAKETLRIWEMYWDAHFKPINRNARLQRRVDLHNKWRIENGYEAGDRTWAGMEQRIFKLRARGVTIEEMRARAAASEGGHTATAVDEKEVGTDDAATQPRTVRRKLFGTTTFRAPKRGADGHPKLTFVDADFAATENPQGMAEARAHTARNIHRRLQTRTADPQTSSAHRSSNAQPDPSLMIAEEQRRKQMEDQKDIVTAGTVVQALDTLINHARNIKGVSRKDIEFALQQGVQEYVAKASKRNPEFARQWRGGQVAEAGDEMTATMKRNADEMAGRKQQVEKMAERRKHTEKMAKRRQQAEKMQERKQQAEAEAARAFEPIDHNDPPW